MALSVMACSDSNVDDQILTPDTPDAPDTNIEDVISKEDVEKSLHSFTPLSLSEAEKAYAEGSVDFAWKLMAERSGLTPDMNTAISPLSASMALSMSAAGAQGKTQQTMHSALGYGNMTATEVNAISRRLSTELTNRDEITKVALANSIWHAPSLKINDNYKSIAEDYFKSDVFSINGQSFVADANAWCSEKTNGLITDFIKPGKTPEWMILNATFFKGIWRNGYAFDASETSDRKFLNSDGKTVSAKMMNNEGEYPYAETDYAQIATIPFGNGSYLMSFVLPKQGSNVDDCISLLAEGDWRKTMAAQGDRQSLLSLSVPKFDIEVDASLKSELSNLGMDEAFAPEADFSGISDSKIVIGDVRQAIKIYIDEKGAMAAAATQIIAIGDPGVDKPSPIEFRCDRPFAFCITEKSTGCVLFIGKVEQM